MKDFLYWFYLENMSHLQVCISLLKHFLEQCIFFLSVYDLLHVQYSIFRHAWNIIVPFLLLWIYSCIFSNYHFRLLFEHHLKVGQIYNLFRWVLISHQFKSPTHFDRTIYAIFRRIQIGKMTNWRIFLEINTYFPFTYSNLQT